MKTPSGPASARRSAPKRFHRRALQLVPVALEGDPHELAARAHARLPEELLERGLDRALREREPGRDLLVPETLEDAPQDLALPLRERGVGVVVPRRIAQAEDVRERALVEEGFAAHHAPDAPEEDGGRVVLVEDPRRPFVQEARRLVAGAPGG